MKKLIYILPLLLISCVKKEIESITIETNHSKQINLFEGKYLIHFKQKEDFTGKFFISKNEINQIKELYNNERIFNYKKIVVYDKYNSIMPLTTVTYSIKLSDSTNQIIIIKSDFRTNPLNTRELKKLQIFIDKIDTILNRKKEIQNLPMSDYLVH